MTAPKPATRTNFWKRFFRSDKKTLAWSMLLCSLLGQNALALPQGEQVVAGSVSFNRNTPDTLNVNSASRAAIVNYQSFNVGTAETVNFNLPNAQSAILNRVIGSNPSEILGRINSNGQVFLINTNGIVFGQNAQVNLGSLTASTLNITDLDFLNGNYRFIQDGKAAGIINFGNLKAQDNLNLLGGSIRNAGTLSAQRVNMLVGKEIEFGIERNIYANVKISQALGERVIGFQEAIRNDGNIFAPSAGTVALQASMMGSVYDQAINNTGVIQAQGMGDITLSGRGGAVINNGSLIATNNNGQGGNVSIFGDRVALLDGSLVDASGRDGGGNIRVGGNYQGKVEAGSPDAFNSVATLVTSGSTLKADALSEGDGGKIILWSDGWTDFRGSLSASGDGSAGDGGFAEISGARSLYARGKYNLLASGTGETGTLLFDPLDIKIIGGTADGSDSTDTSSTVLQNSAGSNTLGSILFADSGASPFLIYESEIENSGANIILQAANSIKTSGTFTGLSIALAPGKSLTLETRNDPGDGVDGIDLTGTTHGANFYLQTNGAPVTLLTGAGANGQAAPIKITRIGALSSDITLQTNGGDITQTNYLTNNTGTLTVNTNGGNAILDHKFNNIGNLVANTNGGNLSYRELDVQSFNLGNVDTGSGNVKLQVGTTGVITQTGTVLTTNNFELVSGTGNQTFNNSSNKINSFKATASSGNITVSNSQNLDLAGNSNVGTGTLNVNLTGASNLTQSGGILTGTTLNLNTGTGSSTLNTANKMTNFSANTLGGDISYTDTDSLVINAASDLKGGDLKLTVGGGGNLTQSAAIKANTLDVLVGNGSATLTNAANDVDILKFNSNLGSINYTDSSSFTLDQAPLTAGSVTLSALNGGNIAIPNLITGVDLKITTTSGNVTSDGTASGDAVKIGFLNLTAQTNSGRVFIEDRNVLSVKSSSVGSGSLDVTTNGYLKVLGAITSTTGNIELNALNVGGTPSVLELNSSVQSTGGGTLNIFSEGDIITDGNSSNLNISTGGALNVKAGRNLTIGENSQDYNLDFVGGVQKIDVGGDLTLIGRSLTGVGGFTRLRATGKQDITVAGDINIKLGTGTTATSPFAAIQSGGNQEITAGGSITLQGSSTNFTNGSNVRIETTGAGKQTVTSNGNLSILGGTGNGATAQINAFSSTNAGQVIQSLNGDINIFSGTGTGAIAFIDNNSLTKGSELLTDTGKISVVGQVGANASVTTSGAPITIKSNSGDLFFAAAEIEAGTAGTLNLNTGANGNIKQDLFLGGSVKGGTLNVTVENGKANLELLNNNFNNLNALATGNANSAIFYRDFDSINVLSGNVNNGTLYIGAASSGSGDINLNGNLFSKNTITLLTLGTGNIKQNSGSIDTKNLTIYDDSEIVSLLSSTNKISELIVNLNILGTDFQLVNTGDLKLIQLTGSEFIDTGKFFSITTTGALDANLQDIKTDNGGIKLLADSDGNGVGALSSVGLLNSKNANIELSGAGISLTNDVLAGSGNLNLKLTGAGNGSQASGTSVQGKNLVATIGSGNLVLDSVVNDFDNVQFSSTKNGNANFSDSDGFNISSASLGTGDLTLSTNTGDIAQTGSIKAGDLLVKLIDTSSDATLLNSGNNVASVSALSTGGNFSLRDQGTLTVGDIDLAGGDLDLYLTGTGVVSTTQLAGSSIKADLFKLTLRGGDEHLFDNANNDISQLSINSYGSGVSLHDTDGFDILGADMDTNNFGFVGSLALSVDTGAITQSGAIVGNALDISTKSANVTLNNPTNDINNLSFQSNSGSLSYYDSDGVTLNDLNTSNNITVLSNLTNVNSNRSDSLTLPPVNGPGVPAEDSLNVLGNISGSNVLFASNNRDTDLNNSVISATNSLSISTNKNINGLTVSSFPKLSAPLIQLNAFGTVGSSTAPIGLSVAIGGGSYIFDFAGQGFVNLAGISSLQKDASGLFYLYPLFVPGFSINIIDEIGSTLLSTLTSETDKEIKETTCSEIGGTTVCTSIDLAKSVRGENFDVQRGSNVVIRH